MYEARIYDRTVEGRTSWDNPRIVELEDDFFPKFIYIKSKTVGPMRSFKRREFDADGYYNQYKYHEKSELRGDSVVHYAEYEEVDKDILIIESE